MSFAVLQFQQAARSHYKVADERQALSQNTESPQRSIPFQNSAPLEAELVRRIASGDCEAFAALYDMYSKPLYSFVYRILSDRRETEDVMQEVFLGIWRKSSSFDESVGKPFNWAVTLTRNKAIDRLRSRDRQLRTVGSTPWRLGEESLACATQRDENFGFDEAAQIRALVDELPMDQRQPIELAFFGGLTHMEIAQAMRKPLGTVKARIRRGMMSLREALEEHA